MSETRSYYAVIPAEVRYDKSLPANAKLLYGEITALCSEKGFCWASNAYFSELYGVSERSVREWIGRLKEAGYIEVNIRYKDDGKTIDSRCISLLTEVRKKSSGVWKKTSAPYGRNLPGGTEENFLENNTDIILQSNDTKEVLTRAREDVHVHSDKRCYGKYKNVWLTTDEYDNLCSEYEKVDEIINFLSAFIIEKNYSSESHYLTIIRWVVNAYREHEQRKLKANANGLPNKQNETDRFMESLRRIGNGEC